MLQVSTLKRAGINIYTGSFATLVLVAVEHLSVNLPQSELVFIDNV